MAPLVGNNSIPQKIQAQQSLQGEKVAIMQTTVAQLTRKQLYDEIWEISASGVAKKYGIPYSQLLKQLKIANIPIPPSGYWTKISFGKPVEKITLAEPFDKVVSLVKDTSLSKEKNAEQKSSSAGNSKETQEIAETATNSTVTVQDESDTLTIHKPIPKTTDKSEIIQKCGQIYNREPLYQDLGFLDDEARNMLMAVAAQILLPDENERMHSAIVSHRKVIAEWKKQQKHPENNRWIARNAPPPPFLVKEIAPESIPRACRILDALIKTMEPLGCKLTNTLAFVVNGETVSISFSESQDKINHIPTKEENRQLLEYEERRKKYSYVSKPQIRKYDYQYNGRLSFTINQQRSFRDCKSYQLEDRLGDMLLELYVAAEAVKQQRLAREEAERKRQEEELRREERRKRYNTEVDRTLALANIAEDYDTACKIRRYIAAYLDAHPDEDISEWLEWANAKADWYDPTISREDEFLGKRNHSKDKDAKTPKHSGYWW